MANLFTQQQVENIFRPFGFSGQATGGAAERFRQANPEANAAYMAAVRAVTGQTPQSQPTGGIVPANIEPRHRFEKEALTALGSGNLDVIRASNPRAEEYLDRFGEMGKSAADLIKRSAGGYDQGTIDKYFNPYIEQVTNRSIDRLSDKAKEMRATLLRNLASQRGNATFGDLYGAQRMGDIDKELLMSSGDIIAQGNQAGFNTALEALFKERANQAQAGNLMGDLASRYATGAGAAQNISTSQLTQGLTALKEQLGAGSNIRGYNQALADAAMKNQLEPVQRGNLATATALESMPNIQGGMDTYSQPVIDRFGTTALGLSGLLEQGNADFRF